MLAADVPSWCATPARGWQAAWAALRPHPGSPDIRYAIRLSLISCTLTAILSVWVAVPLGYLLSRYRFRGKWLLDALLDIPIVLPPLVVGLSLLILFHVPHRRQVARVTLQETFSAGDVCDRRAWCWPSSRWPAPSRCGRCG